MMLPFALPIAAYLLVTVADTVPAYDVTPSCRGAAMSANDTARLKFCIESEQKARADLAKSWLSYTPADRQMCRQAASVGGEPTYTELLTCLEMQRDVRTHPAG